MRRTQSLIVISAVCVCVSVLAGQEKKPVTTPADIIKIMESSSKTYRIESLDKLKPEEQKDLLGSLFPPVCPAVTSPRLVVKDGNPSVEEFSFKPEAVAIIKKAEEKYGEKSYEEARRIYEQALVADPDCYLAVADIGDCYYFGGQPEKALAEYEKAIRMNPQDHRLFFFRANAQLALGRIEEARKSYIHSLMLRPRYSYALQVIEARRDVLKMKIREPFFHPPVLVRKEGEDIVVYCDLAKGPHWLAYANAKAVWLGEPSHRREVAGSEAAGWSSSEERECLKHLLAVYATRADKAATVDPDLELLQKVAEAGDLDYFILYEIYTRLCPTGLLTLSEDIQKEMERFIETYFVIDIQGSLPFGVGSEGREDGSWSEHCPV